MIRPYGASKIGDTVTMTFLNGVAAGPTPMMRTQDFPPKEPTLIMLLATEDVYIKVGSVSVSNPTTNDFLLLKNVYMPVLLETQNDAYLTRMGASAAGTLKATNVTDPDTDT